MPPPPHQVPKHDGGLADAAEHLRNCAEGRLDSVTVALEAQETRYVLISFRSVQPGAFSQELHVETTSGFSVRGCQSPVGNSTATRSPASVRNSLPHVRALGLLCFALLCFALFVCGRVSPFSGNDRIDADACAQRSSSDSWTLHASCFSAAPPPSTPPVSTNSDGAGLRDAIAPVLTASTVAMRNTTLLREVRRAQTLRGGLALWARGREKLRSSGVKGSDTEGGHFRRALFMARAQGVMKAKTLRRQGSRLGSPASVTSTDSLGGDSKASPRHRKLGHKRRGSGVSAVSESSHARLQAKEDHEADLFGTTIATPVLSLSRSRLEFFQVCRVATCVRCAYC